MPGGPIKGLVVLLLAANRWTALFFLCGHHQRRRLVGQLHSRIHESGIAGILSPREEVGFDRG